MVKFERAVIGGKIVANVKTEDLDKLVTTRKKRQIFETKKEREFRQFMEAVAFNWNRYGGGMYPDQQGDIHARSSRQTQS